MAGYVGGSWSLTTTTCQDSGWTLDIFGKLVLKTGWGIVGGTKVSFDLTITFGVLTSPHNVAAKQNKISSWIHEMAIVLTKNNHA
jgi:hypothetical protein